MTSRRLLPAAVLAAAVCGIATPAHATSIIGFGNAIFDNTCANHTEGAAVAHMGPDGGTVGGNGISVPLSNPGNQCGDAGPEAVESFLGGDA
ncbi:hypothetical protein [Streptomyces sp. NPDC093589]|uniref:hypothetical protein n=1 Tax=Streptomyces sp. NPDC093589 TaxID=3366043 RepID=UPI0038104AE6